MRAIDMNDRAMEHTAVELDFPVDIFSEKAKAVLRYYEGAAFLFRYKGKLVITDEGLWLTKYGNGIFEAFGGPRDVVDNIREVEQFFEEQYEDLEEEGWNFEENCWSELPFN